MFKIYQYSHCRTLLFGSKIQKIVTTSISSTPRQYCTDDKNEKSPPIISRIQNLLKCKRNEATTFFERINVKSDWSEDAPIVDTLRILINSGVTMESMLENPQLFATSDLKIRLSFIQEISPNDINDFVPLLIFNEARLKSIVDTAKRDLHVLPDGYVHRIYYFSDKLQTSPKVISKRFVDNPFMLLYDFEDLNNNLEIFLEYDIKPDNLIRDFGVFKHSKKMILARLNRVKAANITKVMPWMIKCVDAVFESAIQSRVAESEALGNYDGVRSFLVGCLDIKEQDASALINKYPRLSSRKVRPMKNIIDYLLSETSYTKEDIVCTPQILFYSLETIEKRVDELRMAGVSLPRLTRLVQGQNRFIKLLDVADSVEH